MGSSSTGDTIWENFKQIAIAIVLAVIIKTSVVEAYKIPSQSMEDTLLVGDFLLANKFIYGSRMPFVNWRLPAISDPEPGDVVIFAWPGDGVTKYIKRCVAVAGDTVEIKNKALFVNSLRFDDKDFVKFTSSIIESRRVGGQDSRDNWGPYVVPRDSYFMMGDNRDHSSDSRYWRSVHRDLIMGEAIIIHWSWDDSIHPSPEVSVTDPLSVPKMFVFNALHFVEKVRWSRLFDLID